MVLHLTFCRPLKRAPQPRLTAEERFWSYTNKAGPDHCWEWCGGKRRGYGKFTYNRRCIPAHRYSWELVNGTIPFGMVLDHKKCRNKGCVNPAHLVLTTHLGNIKEPDGAAGRNLAKTHCPRGHPYAGDNVILSENGARNCRICRNARALASFHRNKPPPKRRSERYYRANRKDNPMTMLRKVSAGDYQVGIYRLCRFLGTPSYPWAVEDRNGQILERFKTLAEGYQWCTGEPLHQPAQD